HLHDRDFRPHRAVKIGKFAPDGPRTDDRDLLRLLLERHRLAAADDLFAFKLNARQFAGACPRADEDILARPPFVATLHPARATDGAGADFVPHAIFTEPVGDPPAPLTGDLARA